MTITQEQYQLIVDVFPKPRGTVKVSNLQALNGILYVLEHGCKWRALPERFGNWHTVYMRMSRWAASGVLDRVFQRLQQEQLIDLEVLGLDSTSVKVHPDGCGALRKRGPQAIGRSRGGLNTKIHMVAASACSAVLFALSPGQDHDAPHGRELLKKMGPRKKEQEGEQLELFLVADRAYEGDETRQLAVAWATRRSSHPEATAATRGTTTVRYTSDGTRSNGSSDGSKATGVSSPATTNST